MIELEACNVAAEMLLAVGFEHRYTSMKSEAAYYGWPGRNFVLRVAAHKAHRHELHGLPIAATITFNPRNFKTDLAGWPVMPREHVLRCVATAIGNYMLVSAGAMRARAKLREYHDDNDA